MAQKAKPVVLGVGNLLLRDEGIGVHVIERLQEMGFDDEADLVDAGTAVFDYLELLETATKLIIVDAVVAGGEPGSVYRVDLSGVDLYSSGGSYLSLHELGLLDSLRWLNRRPDEVIIIGVEPKDMGWGIGLSPEVEAKMPRILQKVIKEIESRFVDIRSGNRHPIE
ncbi:MAG TPA: hydrogenase maturation protease [Candidatus Latescibacteria bacterium]|nr:hydrogenase maturation protease [Candidatus Latescibacterota bacterium]